MFPPCSGIMWHSYSASLNRVGKQNPLAQAVACCPINDLYAIECVDWCRFKKEKLCVFLQTIDDIVHFTSDEKCINWYGWWVQRMLTGPCLWNGIKRPCYLFARKFYPETLERLMFYFSNYTTLSV
ncbi:hypothetical protein Godav_001634 [Gossypium davidsonii]|uniref:Uncharacterized protein n=2 Tax=Gossypium TaxID=3633 RepID=A0A7J8T3P6_GOSDV|nr:hypothetical protein [Gossypium davidsonii]